MGPDRGDDLLDRLAALLGDDSRGRVVATSALFVVGAAVIALRWREARAHPRRLAVPVVAAATALVSFVGAGQTNVISAGFDVLVT